MSTTTRPFARTKVLQARVSKAPTDGSGKFSALVSTFGPPPDSQNDIISPGAFDATIARASVERPGALFSVWWQHGYKDPSNAIGIITSALVTPQGLIVDGQLGIEQSEKAMRVYEGLLSGAIREWSIGYGIVKEHEGTWNGESVNFLDELELLEISAAMSGANRFTRTLAVKKAPLASNDIAARVDAIFRNAFGPPVGPAFVPDAEFVTIKRRIAELEGGSKPVRSSDPVEVRAEIDRILSGEKAEPIDEARVDAFDEAVRQQMAQERLEQEGKRQRQEARDREARIRAFQEPGSQERREAERAEREAAERERLAAEREAERLVREQVDAERRAAALANPLIRQF